MLYASDGPSPIKRRWATSTEAIPVTLENGHLISQATNQPKFPIFAESPTEFFPKAVDAQIEFVKNEKREVNALILHQGGRDIKRVKK
jgi:hypothetical protein